MTDITRTEKNDPEILHIHRKFLLSRHFYSLKQSAKDIADNLISFWIHFSANRHFLQIVPPKKCHDCHEEITDNDRNIMSYSREGSRL